MNRPATSGHAVTILLLIWAVTLILINLSNAHHAEEMALLHRNQAETSNNIMELAIIGLMVAPPKQEGHK